MGLAKRDGGPNFFSSASRTALRSSRAQITTCSSSLLSTSSAPIEGETAQALFKLLEALEDSDDVQNVHANFEISDAEMARLSA